MYFRNEVIIFALVYSFYYLKNIFFVLKQSDTNWKMGSSNSVCHEIYTYLNKEGNRKMWEEQYSWSRFHLPQDTY